LPPSSRGSSPRDLASASGGQDHTPSRPHRNRSSARHRRTAIRYVHRIPRSTFVTIAKRPSGSSAGRADHASDSGLASRIFLTFRKAPSATDWHDGQFPHGAHARTAPSGRIQSHHSRTDRRSWHGRARRKLRRIRSLRERTRQPTRARAFLEARFARMLSRVGSISLYSLRMTLYPF